jgi:hypothetical protein
MTARTPEKFFLRIVSVHLDGVDVVGPKGFFGLKGVDGGWTWVDVVGIKRFFLYHELRSPYAQL